MATTNLVNFAAIIQRDEETYALVPHMPGGIVTPTMLRNIADVADKYQVQAIKISSAQRITLVGVQKSDLENVWKDLNITKSALGLCIRSIKFCPGTTFCRLGQQDAVEVGMKLDELYHGMNLPSKFKMAVSGCANSCAGNYYRDIGLIGTAKGFILQVGGKGGINPRIGDILMENVDEPDVFPIVDKIIKVYAQNGKERERLGEYIDRMGLEEFKKQIEGE